MRNHKLRVGLSVWLLAILMLTYYRDRGWCADALGLRIGGPAGSVTGTVGATDVNIDSADTRIAWIFQATGATVVDTLLFRYGAPTGTPVEHLISIQGVTVTAAVGTPNGTPVATAHFTPPVDASWNGKIKEAPLTHDGAGGSQTTYTLTKGAWYAIVIQPCPNSTAPCTGAATPSGTDKSSFTTVWTNLGAVARAGSRYGTTSTNAGSTWTATTSEACFGYRDSTTTYGFPVESSASTAIGTSAEDGLAFTIPSTWWSTFKVAGVRFSGTAANSGKTYKVALYNNVTKLQETTITFASAATSARNFVVYFSDASLATLNAGTEYIVGISPQDASNGVALTTLSFAAAGDRSAFPGGTNFSSISRTTCGAPCDGTSTAWAAATTTSRPMMELILADITAPAGGGGTRSYPIQ